MSNENLTIQELADIVSELNYKLSDTIFNSTSGADYTLFDGQPICELVTDGSISHIKLLGMYVWNSEDDMRPYLYTMEEDLDGGFLEETPIITLAGEEARIGMKGWLLGQVIGVQSLIEEFIHPTSTPITTESVQSVIDYIEDYKDNHDVPDLDVITGELGEIILRARGEG